MVLREMSSLLSDDALFTHHDPPGDADEAPCGCQNKVKKTQEAHDCGCKKGSQISTMMFKRNLYDMIDDVISLYDHYDDADEVSNDIVEKIAHISDDIASLRKTTI
jgi:hypothetical protein